MSTAVCVVARSSTKSGAHSGQIWFAFSESISSAGNIGDEQSGQSLIIGYRAAAQLSVSLSVLGQVKGTHAIGCYILLL